MIFSKKDSALLLIMYQQFMINYGVIIWLISKHHFLQAQGRYMRKKLSKGGRRPAWMVKELLGKFKQKKKAYIMWKKEQTTWLKHMKAVRECRDAIRKAKA